MVTRHALLAAIMTAALFYPAAAVAQVQITQAKANAGNVTPGDAAGFPITISRPGSYILKGNLTVPNENTHGIVITTSHVTIDLNGFAIFGPTDCSSGLTPCARAGSGNGITTALVPQFNITIRNGTIQGLGHGGVNIHGDSHLIERLHVRSNGGGGIRVTQSADLGGSIVQHNTVQRNAYAGIETYGGVITNNIVDVNFHAIRVFAGHALVSHNVVTRNAGDALYLTGQSGYLENVFTGNGSDRFADPWPRGGDNLGQNLCDGQPCP